MITVPDIISDYARGNMGTPVYTLAIAPAAPDSWTEKRFSTASVTVDGSEYSEALAKSITRIVNQAKAVQFGSTAVFPSVSVKIINKNSIHEELGVDDHIVNRKATIGLTSISTNRCLNSNFSKGAVADADSWTEHPSADDGSGVGTVGRYGTYYYDGSYSCLIESKNATDGSWIECDAITMKRGQKVCASFYARTATGTATIKASLKLNTLYYNITAGTFGAARVINDIGTATTAFTRVDFALDWADLEGTALYTEDSIDVVLEIWSAPNEAYYVDAVQIEFTQKLTDYHHNRYELVAADCLTMFTGIIKRPKWKAHEFEFQLEAWSSNTHRELPIEVVSAESNASWVIPKDSTGKPFPITYGDFQANAHTVWNSEEPELTEFARGILANTDPAFTDGIIVHFDRPGVALHHDAGGVYRLYHFNEDNGRYYEQFYNDATAYSYDDREFDDDLAADARWKQSSNPRWLLNKLTPLMAYLRGRSLLDTIYGYLYQSENSYDGDLSTYSYISVYDSGLFKAYFVIDTFPFPADSIIVDSANNAEIYLLADYTGESIVSTVGPIRAGLDNLNKWANGVLLTEMLAAGQTADYGFRNVPIKRGAAATDKLTDARMFFTDWNAYKVSFPTITLLFDMDAHNGQIFYIYEMGLLVYFTLPIEDIKYSSQLYGRAFEDTWGTRKTAGNLVESPAEVIESLARLELGAVTADINTAQFDAAHTARGSYKVAGQVLELQKSQDIFMRLCKEFGMISHIDRLGRHALISLDYPSSVDDTLTPGNFIEPLKNIEISQTPRESVVTSVKLYYDKNRFTGDYKKMAYCNRTNASGSIAASYKTKCATAYAELGNIEQVLEFECDWVNDDATAELIVKWLIDWNHLQRFIITGPLAMDKINLEIGDYVSLYDFYKYLPSSVTDSSKFLVMETRFLRSKSQYVVTLLEVKEP